MPNAVEDSFWRIFWDCALCGAIGVACGFAVFVLSWEEETTIARFLLILLAVAVLASAFEYVRGVIEGEDHKFSLSRSVIGLFLVAVFELFITALHATLSADRKGWLEIGTAVLGPVLAQKTGAVVNLTAMALVWVAMGSALGAGLSFAIRRLEDTSKPSHKGLAALVGVSTGTVGAPLCVLAYIVLARLTAEVSWMLEKPEEWAQNASNLADSLPSHIFAWPLKLAIGLASEIGKHIHRRWAPILAVVIITLIAIGVFTSTEKEKRNWVHYSLAATPIVLLGAPLLGTSLSSDLRQVGLLVALVAVIWGIPGLILGMLVPYLEEPSEHRRLWAIMAWLTSCELVLIMPFKWMYLIAGVLVLTGLAFWKGASLEQYWPLVALSLAASVLIITRISQQANFFYVQDLSRALVAEPLAKVAPRTRADLLGTLNPRLSFAFDDGFLGPSSGLGFKLGDSFRSTFMTAEDWLKAASERLDAGERLLRDADTLSDGLREQGQENQQLARRISEIRIKEMPELANTQIATEALLQAVPKQLDKLSSEKEQCQKVLDRFVAPIFSLAQVLDHDWKATSDQESKREAILALVNNLAKRERELRDAQVGLDTVHQSLQKKLTDLKRDLTQRFELCMNGSLGFWLPLGLLAGWARTRDPLKHHG